MLLTGKSGIDAESGFVFDVGAEWKGTSPNRGGDYLLPVAALRADFVDDPLFMYQPAERIRLTDGTSLGEVYEPYFDRTPRHFSGHVNTPSQPDAVGFAAGSSKGDFTYFALPDLFLLPRRSVRSRCWRSPRKLIAHALGGQRMIETSLPRAGRATVRAPGGPEARRRASAHARRRCAARSAATTVQPIQDLTTLNDIKVTVATPATSRPCGSSRRAKRWRSPARGRRRLHGAERHRAPDGGDRVLRRRRTHRVRLVGDDGLEPPTSSV